MKNVDEYSFDFLMDYLLNVYQNIFDIWNTSKVELDCYYYTNYDHDFQEILADKFGYLDMIHYYASNGVSLYYQELEEINKRIVEIDKKACDRRRNLRYCSQYNSNCLSIDEAFDIAILDNFWWLDEYEFLKNYYYIDNKGKVRRKNKK